MQADEFQALKDSIEAIGVQNPITLLDGMVIDGWHRYSAAAELGMPCPSVEIDCDIDPKDFVMAQNKARRHITAAQLAMAATAVYAWYPSDGSAQKVGGAAFSAAPIKSSAELAEIAGTGERSIRQAKSVQSHAAPEVIEAVKRGEVGLPKAAAIAKLPMSEQAAALHKPAPKPPAKPAPVVEPIAEEPEDYTELDAANDRASEALRDNVELRNALAIKHMDGTEEEKQQAAALIAELIADLKTERATNRALVLSRDSLMEENTQMKRQMAAQRREIEKLKNNK